MRKKVDHGEIIRLSVVLSLVMLLSPSQAFAHGEEVILPTAGVVLIFLVGAVSLIGIKAPVATKGLAVLPILAAGGFIFWLSEIPYRDNMLLIDCGSIGTALCAVALSIWIQRRPRH